jgi:eukaryotic-like serine/threonine-protein kinase
MHSSRVHPGVTIIVLALFIGVLLLMTANNGNGGSSGQTPVYTHGYSGGFHDDDGTGDDGGGGSDSGGGDAGGGDGGGGGGDG